MCTFFVSSLPRVTTGLSCSQLGLVPLFFPVFSFLILFVPKNLNTIYMLRIPKFTFYRELIFCMSKTKIITQPKLGVPAFPPSQSPPINHDLLNLREPRSYFWHFCFSSHARFPHPSPSPFQLLSKIYLLSFHFFPLKPSCVSLGTIAYSILVGLHT